MQPFTGRTGLLDFRYEIKIVILILGVYIQQLAMYNYLNIGKGTG